MSFLTPGVTYLKVFSFIINIINLDIYTINAKKDRMLKY